jgi:hypothetical protein
MTSAVHRAGDEVVMTTGTTVATWPVAAGTAQPRPQLSRSCTTTHVERPTHAPRLDRRRRFEGLAMRRPVHRPRSPGRGAGLDVGMQYQRVLVLPEAAGPIPAEDEVQQRPTRTGPR